MHPQRLNDETCQNLKNCFDLGTTVRSTRKSHHFIPLSCSKIEHRLSSQDTKFLKISDFKIKYLPKFNHESWKLFLCHMYFRFALVCWIYDLKKCTCTNFQKKKRLDRIISANKKVNLKWKIFDPTVNFSQISCHNSGTISSLDLKFSVFYFDNTYQWWKFEKNLRCKGVMVWTIWHWVTQN